MSTLYEHIGGSYSATRKQDPRIAAWIEDALGDARSVVNVGAGTGAYVEAALPRDLSCSIAAVVRSVVSTANDSLRAI